MGKRCANCKWYIPADRECWWTCAPMAPSGKCPLWEKHGEPSAAQPARPSACEGRLPVFPAAAAT